MRKSPAYFVFILVLALGFGLRLLWQQEDFVLPKNQPLTFIATVKNEPKISYDKQVIEVGDGKVYANLFPTYRVGDKLKIEGKVDERGRIFNAKIEKVGQQKNFFSFFSHLRNKLTNNIVALLPPREATLVVGAVLGVDDISADFKKQLTDTGTIHVVVVSGQNLMIVAGLFMAFAKYIGRRKSLLLSTFAVFLYATLTGFAPPVVRASLMVLSSAIAIYFGRETTALWSLFVAALVIIFVWPQAIFEVSFQLTFAATLGIITLGKKLSDLSNLSHLRNLSFLRLFFENAAIATSAYIFTAPVIFWHFGRISLISPLANVLVAEAVFPIMIFGFLTALASLIFMPMAQIFAYFAYVPALYFVKVVEVAARF